jgi:hypothetical protein
VKKMCNGTLRYCATCTCPVNKQHDGTLEEMAGVVVAGGVGRR